MGEVAYINIADPALNCQQRPTVAKVFTAGNTNKVIETTWMSFNTATKVLTVNAGTAALATAHPYATPSSRLLMQADLSVAEPGTYALIVRYEDVNDANTYYEHPLTVRVFPATEHPE